MDENSFSMRQKDERKASEKHIELANFIKECHIQLRNNSEVYGPQEAWEKHVTQKDKLKTYAESMYKLATEHWKEKSENAPLTYCRIEWIKNRCKDHFFNGGAKKYDDKEIHLLTKDNADIDINCTMKNIETNVESKINILDVGSCYNPFTSEDLFSVTAIDIAPYSNDVLKCDFLKLDVGSKKKFAEDDETLIELPKNSYDAVIFSLLLEYIPCPKQRFTCCEKAQALLKDGGVLFIATPDSKHQGANTKIINTSWKVVLAKLGFMRIHYEKLPHIHCLIFRKCFHKEAAVKQINWKKIPENDELFSSSKIFIPQDFQAPKLKYENSETKINDHNDQELVNLFVELPSEI